MTVLFVLAHVLSARANVPSQPPPSVECAYARAYFGPARAETDRRDAGATITLERFVVPRLRIDEEVITLTNVGVDLDGDVYQAEVGDYEVIARRLDGGTVSVRFFRTTAADDGPRVFACRPATSE